MATSEAVIRLLLDLSFDPLPFRPLIKYQRPLSDRQADTRPVLYSLVKNDPRVFQVIAGVQ